MNNVEFIKSWFLNNNNYLQNDPNKEEILNILTMNVIAFSKLEGLENNDTIILSNNMIAFNSNEICKNEELETILKIVNNAYGYLDLNSLIELDAYSLLIDNEVEGILSLEDIETFFSGVYKILKRNYKDYNFDKFVYKVNGNVFFSNTKFNTDDIEEIAKVYNQDQNLYEVFREENGKLRIY